MYWTETQKSVREVRKLYSKKGKSSGMLWEAGGGLSTSEISYVIGLGAYLAFSGWSKLDTDGSGENREAGSHGQVLIILGLCYRSCGSVSY